MERYEVSSQTVQSSLKILQDAGITNGVPGRGTFVRADFDPEALSHEAGPTDASPNYQVLQQELRALAGEVRTIHERLDSLEAQVGQSAQSK